MSVEYMFLTEIIDNNSSSSKDSRDLDYSSVSVGIILEDMCPSSPCIVCAAGPNIHLGLSKQVTCLLIILF